MTRTDLQSNKETIQVREQAVSSSLPPKRKRDRKHRRERHAKEREERSEAFIHDGEFPGLLPGLYKPADPDPQHDTWAFSTAAYSSDKGPPSPTRTPVARSSDSRTRTGIVYPLQPRSPRPDVCIQVEASLPEPAALL